MIRLEAPLFAQVEITERCNHKCYYCANPFALKRKKINLSKKSLKRIINQTLENKLFSILLTGGEPFLNINGLRYALDYLNESPIDVCLNTNLTQDLTQEDINRLKRISFTLVSLPSHKEEVFRKITGQSTLVSVLRNIEKIDSEGISYGINQVITQDNKESVYETGRFLYEKFNISHFSASPFIKVRTGDVTPLSDKDILFIADSLLKLESETGISTDMLSCIPTCFFPEKYVGHKMANHICDAGRSTFMISPSGEVRKCSSLKESYGNILEEDLKTIWPRLISSRKPLNELCEDCDLAVECYGGCERRAQIMVKDPLIKGSPNISKERYVPLQQDKTYFVKPFRWREESGNLIIGDGYTFVSGNGALLEVLKGLKGKRFKLEDIRLSMGQSGENLLTYLYNRGLVKDEI